MSSVSLSTGTLITADISTLVTLARIQGDIGASPLTKVGLTDCMAQLNTLSFTDYGATANAQVKGWADLLYTALIGTQTNYQQTVTALYAAYNYGLYVAGNYEAWYEMSGDTFANFMGLNASYNIPGWTPPSQSPAWSTTLTSMLNYWWRDGNMLEPHVPGNIIDHSGGYQQQIDFQANLFDPQNWTDAAQVQVNAKPLWDAQSATLHALVTQSSLAENDALLVLFLLVAMVNSLDAPSRSLGYQIANLPTTSQEHPNDTFADQLVYYDLLALADPLGNFALTNGALLALINALIPAVPNQDPGSILLSRVLTEQAKLLNSTSSYPMVDPYNPAISFPVRQTDTLAAINQAWATLSS
ncbi:MAG: hypothetical protein ACTHMP_22980 [Thermomicrobiales bacterium]